MVSMTIEPRNVERFRQSPTLAISVEHSEVRHPRGIAERSEGDELGDPCLGIYKLKPRWNGAPKRAANCVIQLPALLSLPQSLPLALCANAMKLSAHGMA
jgi:hypothetical protein